MKYRFDLDSTSKMTRDQTITEMNTNQSNSLKSSIDQSRDFNTSDPNYICIEDTGPSKENPAALQSLPTELLNSKHVEKLTKELKKALGPCHNFIHGTCLLGKSCLYSHEIPQQPPTAQSSAQNFQKAETADTENHFPDRQEKNDTPDLQAKASTNKSNSNSSRNQFYAEQESKEEGECTETEGESTTDHESNSTICLDEIDQRPIEINDSSNSSETICEDEYVDRLLDKSDECKQSEKGIFSGLYSEPESENNSETSDSDMDFTQVTTSHKISPESAIAPTQSAMASTPKPTSVNPRRPHKTGGTQWKPAFGEPSTSTNQGTSLSRITGPTPTEMVQWNQAYHYISRKGQPKAFSVKSSEKPSKIPTIGSNRPERSTDYYDTRTT